MTTSKHATAVGDIKFMVIAKPLTNKDTGKAEYTVKLEFDGSQPEAMKLKEHLSQVSPKKIVTNGVSKPGNFIVSFASSYQPSVFNSDGQELKGDEIPFFDGRVDQGQAAVIYNVIQYDKATIVRLAAVKIKDLQLTEKEETQGQGGSLDDIRQMINGL